MEPLWKLLSLLEPAPLVLISTALFVVYASAQRALNYEKETERHRDFSETSITLDSSQALMIPIASSLTLILMFYLFSSVSNIVTAFTCVASATALTFCLTPYISSLNSHLGYADPVLARCCSYSLTRTQCILIFLSSALVILWLVSGHWMLNNLLGISICIAFVSHVRLPNIKICALLLVCLFVYDIFWVFFSERFFGANVMVSVATQQALNPVHTVANSLKLPLPGLQSISKKVELPVKLVFPKGLLGGPALGGNSGAEFMMLGLGDMAIPGMLLALVLCFDFRKSRDLGSDTKLLVTRGFKYIWHALLGYTTGLIAALAAGVLTQSPQPALLYLVPSTLGPVVFAAWIRNELKELWNGPRPVVTDKVRLMEV
uniref:TSA: Wollemia nobilis Ref_Wollemi_Transcript_25560_1899 transcribed RNA sequence n=1 Tax=Wollemia nobilis TaxID=56998 RepID=A0A0C9RGT6_9CONI